MSNAGRHILFVDDDEAIQAFVSSALRALGHKTTVCTDAQEAVDFFRDHHDSVDLVILDMVLGKARGEVVFHMLRQTGEKVPVALISGFCDADAVDRLLKAGACEFLPKPFTIDDLSLLVAKHARGHA